MPTERENAVLERMTRLLAGGLPLAECQSILAPDVIKHMDDYRSVGIEGWRRWFHFLREKGRVRELSAVCERTEDHADGTVTLHGRWQGVRGGKPVAADGLKVRYRIEGDRIAELWTTRANYVFFFGPIIRYRAGLWLVYVYMRLWHLLAGRRSLERELAGAAVRESPG